MGAQQTIWELIDVHHSLISVLKKINLPAFDFKVCIQKKLYSKNRLQNSICHKNCLKNDSPQPHPEPRWTAADRSISIIGIRTRTESHIRQIFLSNFQLDIRNFISCRTLCAMQVHIVPRTRAGDDRPLPPVVLTLRRIERYFSLPLYEASKQLGVSTSSLKW